MAQGKLTIHTENILPIIKKWLYAEKEIFLRELVANACDALNKLKILGEAKEADLHDTEMRIDVSIDKGKKILVIADTGIGMTSEEVEKYIAQVAFSGAEEFLTKYKGKSESDQIIGHFGLGFYSAYMVAAHVAIDTLSYLPGSVPVLWGCDGSSNYTLDPGKRAQRGTSITLTIDKENEEFLEESRVRGLLQRYSGFLPFPIYLNGSHINPQEPLWIKSPPNCTDKEYLDFYRTLYPFEADPVLWIHLNVDYPFNLKGILYFPRMQRRYEWDKNTVKLFCNRVFVADNCKDLLPDFLMILRGAIDSPDIPLNVSRSYLQVDRTVRQVASHISKKIADRLASLYTSDRNTFIACWSDIEMIVKLGVLQDEKFFEKAKEFLIWKTLTGEWVTLADYKSRAPEASKNKVFYTADEKLSPSLLDLYKKRGLEILIANPHVDAALMDHLERHGDDLHFQRIDGKLDEAVLDTAREKTLLDPDGKTESSRLADFFRNHLTEGHSKLEVEAKSLAADNLPALLVVDEETRRLRDYLALSGQALPSGMEEKRTFVLNTNNKLVNAIYGMREKNPELAKEITTHLYDLSLLAQKGLEPAALSSFIERTTRILDKLVM